MKRPAKEWALRIGILLAGLSVAHLGVTLFLLSDLGSDPFNVFVQGIFRTLSRLGGVAGAGTLVCMFLVGPVASFFLPVYGRWIEALVSRIND